MKSGEETKEGMRDHRGQDDYENDNSAPLYRKVYKLIFVNAIFPYPCK